MGMERVFGLVVLGCALSVHAQPPDVVVVDVVDVVDAVRQEQGSFQVRWDMNSAEELAQDWWHWSNASTTFEHGIATIGGESYEEWMQRTDKNQSLWWETIDARRGFRIQAQLRVLRAECGGVGFWIHDGARLLKVHFCDQQVGVGWPFREYVPVDTSVFRTYTIEGRADWIRVLVDGQVVIERQGPDTTTGAGTAALTFGNLGGAPGVAQWDWLSYDTRPELIDPGQSY